MTPRRPRLWAELVLGLAVFGVYTAVSVLPGPGREAAAVERARAVYDLERWLHLDVEPALNDWLHPHPLLVTLANYEYATTYVISAFLLLFWLLARRPADYRPARTSFVLLNLLAIGCFALFPTAPPRLVPDQGFVDTVFQGRTWGSWGSPIGDHANQLAAMPSLHFAWAVWVSVVLARLGGGRPLEHNWKLQVASAVHVAVTFLVIVATGNHYVLDAVAGFALAAFSVLVVGRPGAVPAGDAFFLHVERPDAPQVVGALIRTGGPVDPGALTALVAARLDELPRFRQRVARRTRRHRWRWAPARPDLGWHVLDRRAEPVGEVAARLVAEALPRDRPPWRFAVADGGVVFVAHHVVADGIGLVAAVTALLEPRPVLRLPAVPPGPVLPGLAGLAADTLRGAGRLRLPTGGGRDVAVVELPLAAVRAAARRAGAGVPDLLLSLLAGALGPVVDRPGTIRVSMPLTTRAPGDPDTGNRTGAILVDLPVAPGTRPDPAVVAASVARLAGSGRPAAARAVQRLFGVLPPPLHALVARLVYGPGTFAAIVSCMPGPRAALTLTGVPVEAVFPLVPPAPGTALAVGTLTWNGRLCLTVETDPALAPAAVLAAALAGEFAALGRAGAGSGGEVSGRGVGPRPGRG